MGFLIWFMNWKVYIKIENNALVKSTPVGVGYHSDESIKNERSQ